MLMTKRMKRRNKNNNKGDADMDKYNCEAYESELYHYGVPGMKWGERRFQAKQSAYSSKIRKYNDKAKASKTGIGARYNIAKANQYKNLKDFSSAYKNANSIGKKLSVAAGIKRAEIMSKNASNAYAQMKNTTKNERAKRKFDAYSYNNKSLSKYYKAAQHKNLGERFVAGSVFDKQLRNMPIQRISGRKTTVGKNYLDIVLTGGIGGAIADAKYKKMKKKADKAG